MHCRSRYLQIFIIISVSFFSSLSMSSDSITRDTVNNVMEQAEEQKQNVPEPVKPSKTVEDAINNIQDVTNSKEFKDRIEQYQDAFRQQFDVNPDTGSSQSKTNDPFKPAPSLSNNERIYVFVSSSMPKATLKNYFRDVDQLHDPNVTLVMRGFVGPDGMKYFKPTQRFILGLLLMDENCKWESGEKCKMYRTQVQIDPMLFTRYEITAVPAIVYVNGVNILEPKSSEGLPENVEVSKSVVLYGDVSLESAIEKIYLETNTSSLKVALEALRKGFYQ